MCVKKHVVVLRMWNKTSEWVGRVDETGPDSIKPFLNILLIRGLVRWGPKTDNGGLFVYCG